MDIFCEREFKEKIIDQILEDKACPLCKGTNLIYGKDLHPATYEYNFYCLKNTCTFRGPYKELIQRP
jgi:hypothetical protein